MILMSGTSFHMVKVSTQLSANTLYIKLLYLNEVLNGTLWGLFCAKLIKAL